MADPRFQDFRVKDQGGSGSFLGGPPGRPRSKLHHPTKVSVTAGYLLGPGTLEKGGYGLSRPGGNLGFRV